MTTLSRNIEMLESLIRADWENMAWLRTQSLDLQREYLPVIERSIEANERLLGKMREYASGDPLLTNKTT